MTSFQFERNRSRFRSGQPAFLCARIHRLKTKKPYISLIHKVFLLRITLHFKSFEGGRWDSNPRSPVPQTGALTNYANPTISGAPKGTRTPDLLLRRQLLYPAELLAHQLLTSVSLYIIPIYGIFVNTFLNFFHI